MQRRTVRCPARRLRTDDLDGASAGTCVNVLRLAVTGSPCVVYDMLRGTAATIHDTAEWSAMLHNAGPEVRNAVEARMTPDEGLALPA